MAVTCRPLGREGRRPPSTLTWVLSSHCQWWDPFPFSRTKLGLNPFQQDEIVTPSISPGQNCDSFPFNRTKLGLLPFQQDKIGTPSLSTGQNWNPFLSVGQSWTLSTGQNCDSFPFNRTKLGLLPFQQDKIGTPSLPTAFAICAIVFFLQMRKETKISGSKVLKRK